VGSAEDSDCGDYIEVTAEQLNRCVTTGEFPWLDEFRGSAGSLRQVGWGITLVLHSMPYLLAAVGFTRLAVFEILGIPRAATWTSVDMATFHSFGLLSATLSAFASLLSVSAVGWLFDEVLAGVSAGVVVAAGVGLASGAAFGIADTMGPVSLGVSPATLALVAQFGSMGSVCGIVSSIIPYVSRGPIRACAGLVPRILLTVAGVLVSALACNTTAGVVLGISFGLTVLRAYYLPLHWTLRMLFWLDPGTGAYKLHPIYWDEVCPLPFPGVHRLLVARAAGPPTRGAREISRLLASCPSQRYEAALARTILIAREARRCTELGDLEHMGRSLPTGAKRLLPQVRRIRRLLRGIVVAQRSASGPEAGRRAVAKFLREARAWKEPLASEFSRAAETWLSLPEGWHAAVVEHPKPQKSEQPGRVRSTGLRS
jgi:hypothetical protein